LAACADESTGPGILYVTAVGAATDTTWVGAPGEPIPGGVSVRVKDPNGAPAAGASIIWDPIGRNAQIVSGSELSNAQGLATAVWLLGTDASEEQQLRVMVEWHHRTWQLTLRARAVPHVVAQLRVSVDSPAVLRVGDSLPIVVTAIDPFGNTFPAPPARLSLTDTTMGKVAGAVVIGGPRRGATELTVTSNYVSARIPLQVVQYVASIRPASDTLYFTSLNAQRPVQYVLRDDRGGIVSDTSATLAVGDTSVAQLTDSGLKAVKPGITTLQLAVGSVRATTVVNVQQRVASLALRRDTIRFDALLDTTTIYAIARDSLGSPIYDVAVVVQVGDADVAKLADQLVIQALTQGVTVLTLLDPATGISVSAPLVVAQRTASIELSPLSFDALDDTLPIQVAVRDRLGSPIPNAALEYSVSDTTVATIEPGNRIRSVREGHFVLTIRDPETAASVNTDVTVAQRVTALQLSADTVTFDALTDSLPVAFTAWDRRGVRAASARISYSSSDRNVVAVSPEGAVSSVGDGSALVIGQSADGPSDTLRVNVAQRVAGIVLQQDSVVFESLRAVRAAGARPVDRLGVVVSSVPVSYTVEDSRIAEVDSAGEIRAVANGTTGLLLVVGSDTSRVGVRVTQRPVRVNLSADTIRFDALGDSQVVVGRAVDSLGSAVPGVVQTLIVDDTAVSTVIDSVTLLARGNGTTVVKVTVAGLEAEVVASVRQVPTHIVASLSTVDSVVDLPIGSIMPVVCEARDKNDYIVPVVPLVAPSSAARWVGTRCDSLRVMRSGMDTLRLSAGLARKQVGLNLVVRPPDTPTAPGVVLRVTAQPNETFISWVRQDPAVNAAAAWIRTLGTPSWDQKDIPDTRSWLALPGYAPGTTLEAAVTLTGADGEIRETRFDTVTVGTDSVCSQFAGHENAGGELRVFCTAPDLLNWVRQEGLAPEGVYCGTESLVDLAGNLPNCVFQYGSSHLLLLRGLGYQFRPGPLVQRELLQAAYRDILFGNASPEATIWKHDPAIGTALAVPRVGGVTGYQSAVSWSTDVNAVGTITWFEPPNPNGAIAIYHEGHGGDATDLGAETISWLLQRRWSVVAVSMPRVSHMSLRDDHWTEGNPLWRMLYGIGQVTEWIHKSWAPGRDPVVVAVGRSGGGWSALLYAALDQRIDATAVVNGFVPINLRLAENDLNLGDWEQNDPLTFSAVDYTDLVRLADTRDLLLTYSELDPCCFRILPTDPYARWLELEGQEVSGRLTTLISNEAEHGLSQAGYAALDDLLNRALARGH